MVAENLSHYRVLKKLGAGKVGEVYLAQDTTLGRTVALKIFHAKVAEDPDLMDRFLQEAKVASSLDHPNVIWLMFMPRWGVRTSLLRPWIRHSRSVPICLFT